MKPLQVIEQISPRLVAGPVLSVVHPLPFEDSEESLACRVVGAVAYVAHAADQRISAEKLLVGATDELASSIRMRSELGLSFPLPHGHLHRPDHHVTVLAMVHRPAHHQLAAASIDDVREAAWWWMLEYNEERPHDSLGDLTPLEYRE